jgi:hypothetical protein
MQYAPHRVEGVEVVGWWTPALPSVLHEPGPVAAFRAEDAAQLILLGLAEAVSLSDLRRALDDYWRELDGRRWDAHE